MDSTTMRTTVASTLMEMPELVEMGLPVGAVYDADMNQDPEQDSLRFIVVRWLDAQPGMGYVKRRPFYLWGYDRKGDRTPMELILNKAGDLLAERLLQVETSTGRLMQIEKGEFGGDMQDEAYDALVVPLSMVAVGHGS